MSTTNYFKTALLLGLLTGLILAVGGSLGGRQGMTIALVLAGVMNLASYWFSDKIVLAMYRGREVSPAEAPRFHAIVDRLIARAGLPKPKLYLLP
jgi:heat shock protein HtpX